MPNQKLDVIIFGASGFTGKHAILEGVEILKRFSWGIAGRNESNLKAILQEIGEKASKDLSHTPIVIADVNDENSLLRMAERAKIIINCCGPYRFLGEPVIKACIEAGTNYVDVTGEAQFMERMQLEYDAMAREKGVYVISACGFDSIPAEMGIQYLEQQFDGELNSVECYLKIWLGKHSKGGSSINYGTWASGVHIFSNLYELSDIRKKLFKVPLPEPPHKVPIKLLHKSKMGRGWCVPLVDPFPDLGVVSRTQRYFYEVNKKRPIQFNVYHQLPSIIHAIGGLILGVLFFILVQLSFGRKLLLKYPEVFSFGMFTRSGPSDDVTKNMKFSMSFYGKGWPRGEQLAEPTDRHSTEPTKQLVTRVTGTNPAYGATTVALLLSATTILTEKDKLPKGGGILTPGVCFAKTNLISNLCKHGFKFETISETEYNIMAN